MMRAFLHASIFLFLFGTVNAQGVGINTNSPDPSAVLDVSSNNLGFLPPRMTEAERNAISNPAAGLQVYNTDNNCINYYDGTRWNCLCGTGNSVQPTSIGPISGGTSVQFNDSENYSIGSVAGADTYTWSVPSGWSINSGQGTTTVNLTAGSTSGNVIVEASNACGAVSDSLAVTVLLCNAAWDYYCNLDVINTSGTSLSNHQVLVQFDHQALVSGGKSTSSGSDLRFATLACDNIDYWIEPGTNNTTNCKVWIKVPSVPANDTAVVVMYYGNSGASAGSNGPAVFEVFDDFESYSAGQSPANWTVSGLVAASVANDGGNKVYSATANSDGQYAYRNDVSFGNFIYEGRQKVTSYIDQKGGLLLRRNAATTYYFWHFNLLSTDVSLYKRVSGSQSQVQSATQSLSNNTWYDFKCLLNGSSIQCYNNGVLVINTTDASIGSGYVGIVPWSQSIVYYDNLRVRKYANPEPSVNVGSEVNN